MTEEITGHVVVLGLGRSGRAVAEYLTCKAGGGANVRVTVVDGADSPALSAAAAGLRAVGAEVLLGTNDVPSDANLIVASPGIPPASALMTSARANGAPVIGEIELAYRVSRSPWVAITGTNGKTTTTALVAHILETAGLPVETVGNIGYAATAIAAGAGPATVLVAEVSSFQLMLTERFHPRVSVLLNITPDHIDYHGSLEAYAADKARVFANQTTGDTAVIDVDDPGSAPYADTLADSGVDVCRVSRTRSFEHGATVTDGMLVLRCGDVATGLVRVDELKIRGDHNVSNALAAAAAAHAAGAGIEGIREGLRTFEPIEHRLEPAGVVGGVEYFNDSKATNPDAVLKALTAFDERPLVVLLGGHNKGNDFGDLAGAVCARSRAAVVFGECAAELEEAFWQQDGGCRVVRVPGMSEAVSAAAEMAHPGDVVVLSPACASFDEFDDYEHRGRVFKDLVATMAKES
ncbi:MAG: UDP-N-acetylmuramoyl-L-alanine--D-glutamate ligase [Coriobacteriia bacterium]